MAWRWLGDKSLSGPTRDNYLYHFTNSDLLYIWCPRVDAISLITRRPLHSKGNHSPHGLYTQLFEIHNFGVKFITGLCQLIWTVTLGGYANIGNIYIGKTASLYWTVSQYSNVRDQVQCFCYQQCYINHYNTPPEGCWHMTPFRMQHRNAITRIAFAPDLQQQTTHTHSTQMRTEMYSNTAFAQGQKQLSGCNDYR